MPKWNAPSEVPDCECGDRIVIIVDEVPHLNAKRSVKRLVILEATEDFWKPVEDGYFGYGPADGVCWAYEMDVCAIADHIMAGD